MRLALSALYKMWLVVHGVQCGDAVKVRGRPILYRASGATIKIGNRVVIQSVAKRYHAHMHSAVKLLADHPGAVIEIGDESRINGACIHAVTSVIIGKRCLLAAGVQVLDSNGHRSLMETPEVRVASVDRGRPVVVEDDVWIGLNTIVLPGTRIGAGSVIGAGVVLSGDIPPRSIVRAAPVVLDTY